MLASNHVMRRVRRSSIMILVLSSLALIIIWSVGTSEVLPYFQSMLRGPQKWLGWQLVDANPRNTVYFVEVDGRDMYDTGYEYTESNYGITTNHAYYGALDVGGSLMIVEVGNLVDDSITHYVGTLQPVSRTIQREVINAIVEEQPELDGVFLPVMLNTRDAYSSFWRYLGGIVWVLLLTASIFGILKSIRFLLGMEDHWILTRLAHYGDRETIIAELEQELSGDVTKIGQFYATANWLVSQNFFGIQAMRYDTIIWHYRQVTQTRVYGINTGKVYTLYVYDKSGKQMFTQAKELQVTEMMKVIYEHAPWAVVGYTHQLMHSWKNNLQGFIQAIEQRQLQIADYLNEDKLLQPAADATGES